MGCSLRKRGVVNIGSLHDEMSDNAVGVGFRAAEAVQHWRRWRKGRAEMVDLFEFGEEEEEKKEDQERREVREPPMS